MESTAKFLTMLTGTLVAGGLLLEVIQPTALIVGVGLMCAIGASTLK